jgi:3-hydroxyisobutyrate dehydrogenase-like beta-hydroxyacid dehydrogenase
MTTVGFIGLGNMGSALAANIVDAGFELVAHDAAGSARAPKNAGYVDRAADVARACDVVVFSLPDGAISEAVAREIAAAPERRTTYVVDTSTVGVDAARTIAAVLGDHGIAYVDAPVSGGPAGARARTLAVMYAAPDAACEYVESVLAALSDRRFRVGDRPGMAQAVKLANNFLSATALAATSDAVAFGLSVGLDMTTLLDVLNAASGANTATAEKFPNHVVTGRYASGFSNTLMEKDVALYLRAVEGRGGPSAVGVVIAEIWRRFATTQAGADFTRIYPFVSGS